MTNKPDPFCNRCGGEGWYERERWDQHDGGAVMMPEIVKCECTKPPQTLSFPPAKG